jgi:hypothetical protein
MFTFCERDVKMNTADAALLDAAAHRLRERHFDVAIRPPRRADTVDAWFRVTKDKKHAEYAVGVKRQLTPQTLGAVVAQLEHQAEIAKLPPLLVTAHITPPMADRLTELKQQFVDAAGNAYLDAPGLFVLITGRKPVKRALAGRPGRAFNTAGIKTLFAFICKPELAAATYREIADAAGVALGGLPEVLAGLQQAGHLHVMGKKRKLIATKRLLDEWALAYARTLRPKQLLRTLVAPTFAAWREWNLPPDQLRWGAEPAAALLTKYLQPGVLTIYTEKIPATLIVEHRLTTARAGDEHNLVEMRKPFWGRNLIETARPDIVPPALIYADLLATGDARCIEAAQMIYGEHLAGLLTAQ